jgi:hypothetical protein
VYEEFSWTRIKSCKFPLDRDAALGVKNFSIAELHELPWMKNDIQFNISTPPECLMRDMTDGLDFVMKVGWLFSEPPNMSWKLEYDLKTMNLGWLASCTIQYSGPWRLSYNGYSLCLVLPIFTNSGQSLPDTWATLFKQDTNSENVGLNNQPCFMSTVIDKTATHFMAKWSLVTHLCLLAVNCISFTDVIAKWSELN